MKKPIIGITMGEPAGIGPEIAIKALCDVKIRQICHPFILGDKNTLEDAYRFSQGITNKEKFNVVKYDALEDILFNESYIPVLDFHNVDVSQIQFGKDSEMGGKASGEYIKKSIELALEQKIDAVVTGPISKVSFKMGGWGLKYAGHTEMFADLTNTDKYGMLLAHGNFRVIHATTHIPYKDVPSKITRERILDTLDLAYQSCTMFGIENPKIIVCGLNPHAGESGKIGEEDANIIAPAIDEFRKKGVDVTGPSPADTVWSKVLSGAYDIGVAMYHDQGHIPTKLLGFQYEKDGTYKSILGMNITVGIPIIRVSVDHGVAYGKSGKGIATPSSLIQSIETATQLAQNKYY
ncbi:MAG: 4-hydroxythreonine-4-phosphate dehydrogenase PdxA [Nanoarchaeota archaeon]|nr:4-hydroxythreonine-4-phosphate dehydrogenase PdxA [Nanoarchaeota archaeon]MBU1321063.1 4-hydroxythreonine-4-phosphate dehydrogenase PdxA [Nanoarchaeota archaeon]MBU1597069.1 4-hydroxythreonine-4-phosphate dehydrogenase PdxA [Nanoarchaeota archaeon]MBU2440859.1 4-hydroxythreonine-4-phosphate dehydrogenase PdxA [Nanoarchaeota archaeon]